MGKLGNISGKDAANAFEKAGWQRIGQVGSHLVLSKPGVRVNLSIPQHKELATGTLRALIRNSGMTVDEFISLLRSWSVIVRLVVFVNRSIPRIRLILFGAKVS